MSQQLPTLDAAALTDIGLKRQKNEDNFALQIPPRDSPQHDRGAIFIVADGMGGMGGGDIASLTAVQTLMKEYYAASNPDPMAALKVALEAANVAVREKAVEANRPRIGSTAAGLVLMPSGEGLWFNVGDARVYRARQNFMEQVSHDQSVLQHQLDAGFISEEDARIARNVNVTMFIGQSTPVQPVYRRGQAQPGDIFVLCSDGLWDLVEASEILQVVQNMPAQDATRKLVDMARKRGAPDNVTVIVVRVGPKPKRRPRWLVFGALALILAAVGAAGIILSQGKSSDKSTPIPTTQAAVAAAQTDSPTATLPPEPSETPSPVPTHTAAAAIIVHTSTLTPTLPSATPSMTATDTLTPTATYTHTPTMTRTPTQTRTPSATATATDTPTITRTPTETLAPTLTSLPPTETPLPTSTPRPSDTPMMPPTVTLNPTIITWTPSPSPSPTPTLSPEQQVLLLAAQDGVVLKEMTTLYIMYSPVALPILPTPTPGPFQIIEMQSLEAGTEVLLKSEIEQPHPDQPDLILREVEVKTGAYRGRTGWIDQHVLETSEPITPHLIVRDPQGVNVRYGDDQRFRRVATLSSGQTVKIIGISSRGTGWFQVELPNGDTGWVSPFYVEVIGSIANLSPVVPPALPVVVPTTQAPEPNEVIVTESPTNPPPPAPPTAVPSSGDGGSGGDPGTGDIGTHGTFGDEDEKEEP